MLLKGIIYGMSLGIRSSRRLELAFRYYMRFLFLMSMAKPDYRTIARFRRSMDAVIAQVFRSTVLLAREMGMVLLEQTATDGSKMEAVGARRRYHTLESVGKDLTEIVQPDRAVAAGVGGQRPARGRAVWQRVRRVDSGGSGAQGSSQGPSGACEGADGGVGGRPRS